MEKKNCTVVAPICALSQFVASLEIASGLKVALQDILKIEPKMLLCHSSAFCTLNKGCLIVGVKVEEAPNLYVQHRAAEGGRKKRQKGINTAE